MSDDRPRHETGSAATGLEARLAREGTTSSLAGNEPLLLHDPDAAWLVVSGRADVFAVRLEPGSRPGRRTHLFRVDAGSLLLGTATEPSSSQVGLLAVGVAGTRVIRVPKRLLSALGREEETAPRVAALLDHWLASVWHGLGGGLAPRRSRQLAAGTEVSLEDGQIVTSRGGTVWVSHLVGETELAWWDRTPLCSPEALMPVPPGAWLHASGPCTLRVASTADALGSDRVWEGIEALLGLGLAWEALSAERTDFVDMQRIRKAEDTESRMMRRALGRLGGVLQEEGGVAGPLLAPGDDPLMEALRAVGRVQGIDFRPAPSRRGRARSADPLQDVVRESRVRVRRVVLGGSWWKKDGGPLLGFLSEGGAPVALLPLRGRQYTLLDPAAGTSRRLDGKTAAALAPHAYSFTRPLPGGPVGALPLLRFGLHGCTRDLVTLLLLGAAAGALGMVVPVATGALFNTIIPGGLRHQLLQLAAVLVVCALSTSAFLAVRSIAFLRLQGRADAAVQAALWDRLLELPVPFFRSYSAGDLALRSMAVNDIRSALSEATVSTVLGGAFAICSVPVLFYYSWRLALVGVALTALAACVAAFTQHRALRHQRRLFECWGRLGGLVFQLITGISKLRVAGAEGRAWARWAERFAEQKEVAVRSRGFANLLAAFISAYPVAATAVIFALAASGVPERLPTGDFLAFSAAFGGLLTGVLGMSFALLGLQAAVPLYERVRPILESCPEVDEGKAQPGELVGGIEVSHVCFRYTADGPLALDDLTFAAEPGELVALVGPSGSGKSTLLRLLLGFEAPQGGSIYYDRKDLATLDLGAVRRQIGTVLQNGQLLTGDILHNIIGSSLLTEEDAWEAARMAGVEQDIREMPMGMRTIVSEGGGTLSGGQRQRLLIARAVVARPRILFFDEATSALDNRTQAVVSESLAGLDATRLVIAHRLSTVMHADRIIVLDAGRAVETGSYGELMARDGLFRRLAARQLT